MPVQDGRFNVRAEAPNAPSLDIVAADASDTVLVANMLSLKNPVSSARRNGIGCRRGDTATLTLRLIGVGAATRMIGNQNNHPSPVTVVNAAREARWLGGVI